MSTWRDLGERAANTLRALRDDNARLAAELRRYRGLEAGPPPEIKSDPGYTMWSALMEDLREEGVMRMTVRADTHWAVGYVPTDAAS